MTKHIEFIKIKDLSLLENNPRRISAQQLNKLCTSLEADKEFFEMRPCLVNRKDGKLVVYAGNQRVRAAKKLKWKEVPCLIEDDLDEQTMNSRIIKDNKSFGDWDFDILGNEWEACDLVEWGFTPDELVGSAQDIEELEGNDDTKSEKVKCELCGK